MLHVVFEQDPSFNGTITSYFENLKANGMGFDVANSNKYGPLSKEEFRKHTRKNTA